MAKIPSLSNSTALRDETVLRRVRHLGSARDGLREWRLQRLTAIALIPLGLYFAASMLWLATSDQSDRGGLARLACTSVAGHPLRTCGACACAGRAALGSPRLCAHARSAARGRAARPRRRGDPRRRRRARRPQALSRSLRRLNHAQQLRHRRPLLRRDRPRRRRRRTAGDARDGRGRA